MLLFPDISLVISDGGRLLSSECQMLILGIGPDEVAEYQDIKISAYLNLFVY